MTNYTFWNNLTELLFKACYENNDTTLHIDKSAAILQHILYLYIPHTTHGRHIHLYICMYVCVCVYILYVYVCVYVCDSILLNI